MLEMENILINILKLRMVESEKFELNILSVKLTAQYDDRLIWTNLSEDRWTEEHLRIANIL